MKIHNADKFIEFFRSGVKWEQGDILHAEDREPELPWVVLKSGNVVSFPSQEKAEEFAQKWIDIQNNQPCEWARLNRGKC